MSHGFKKGSKWTTNCRIDPLLYWIELATGNISPEITAVFDTSLHGRFIKIKETSEERKFKERIKAPIFLDAVLAAGIM